LIFEGGANWVGPEKPIRFEYTTKIDEFVSDEEYNSSEEDESDHEDERRRHAADDALGNEDGVGYMNPLQKAKITHLIARLPTTNSKLRRGDVARVTAFAIEHASAGAEEVVEMLVANILSPFAYSRANPDRDDAHSALREGEQQQGAPAESTDNTTHKSKEDTSAAKLVGLYVISDIFSSSSTSGVRHAWRYRQLFEQAFRAHNVFEHLGRLEKEFRWGRLKAEKWKRSIGSILHLWEGWSVFPHSSQDHFVQVFENPPLTEEELAEEKKKAEAEKASAAATSSKGKSRWKTVDDDAAASVGKFDSSQPEAQGVDEFIDELDGEPMSDIDGVPMEDSDLDEAELDGQPLKMDTEMVDSEEQPPQAAESEPASQPEEQAPAGRVRKPRPKAEDMFADSDDED
jgi:U2-associated protein SR140